MFARVDAACPCGTLAAPQSLWRNGGAPSPTSPAPEPAIGVKGSPPRTMTALQWVKPKAVAEVQFVEWTRDGLLRHPEFVGVREDKAPWRFGGGLTNWLSACYGTVTWLAPSAAVGCVRQPCAYDHYYDHVCWLVGAIYMVLPRAGELRELVNHRHIDGVAPFFFAHRAQQGVDTCLSPLSRPLNP